MTMGPTLSPTPSMNVTGRRRAAATGAGARRSRGGQPRNGEPSDDLGDLAGEPPLDALVVARPDRLDDDPADQPHLVLAEAAGRGRGRAQPDARRRVRWQRVERDAVLVD